MVIHACNAHSWEGKAGGEAVQCRSLLWNKLEVGLECVRPYLYSQTKQKSLVTSKLLKPQFHSLMEDSNIVFKNKLVKN